VRDCQAPPRCPDHATVEIEIPEIGIRRFVFPPDDELLDLFLRLSEAHEGDTGGPDRIRASAACVGLWWGDDAREFEATLDPTDLPATGRAVLRELWAEGWPSEVVLGVASALVEEGRRRIISEREVSDRVGFIVRPPAGAPSAASILN